MNLWTPFLTNTFVAPVVVSGFSTYNTWGFFFGNSNNNGMIGSPSIITKMVKVIQGFWLIYFLISGIFASRFFNLATPLREIAYLLKETLILFYKKWSSEILSLQSVNLPKNELFHRNFSRVWHYSDYRFGMLKTLGQLFLETFC